MPTIEELQAQIDSQMEEARKDIAIAVLDKFGTRTFKTREITDSEVKEWLAMVGEDAESMKPLTARNRLSVQFKKMKAAEVTLATNEGEVTFKGTKEEGDRKPTWWRFCLTGEAPEVKSTAGAQATGSHVGIRALVKVLDLQFAAARTDVPAVEVWKGIKAELEL